MRLSLPPFLLSSAVIGIHDCDSRACSFIPSCVYSCRWCSLAPAPATSHACACFLPRYCWRHLAVRRSRNPLRCSNMAYDLDCSQQDAWEAYLSGKNVALFGRAGSGKSVVLRRCIAHAQRMHGVNKVGIVAWTTHAASLIGGITMHKFLRIGIAELPKEAVLEKVRGNMYTKEMLKNVKVIVIDELPQMASRWLVVFEYVVRQMAMSHKQSMPWGGCQVVGALSLCAVSHVSSLRGFGAAWIPFSPWLLTCRHDPCHLLMSPFSRSWR